VNNYSSSIIAVTLNRHEGSEPKGKEPSEKKMSNKECRAPVFTKKENVMLAQHIEILDQYHKKGKNQSKMVKHFDAIYPNLKMHQPLVVRGSPGTLIPDTLAVKPKASQSTDSMICGP
jgi:hypothetical protein